MGRKRRITIAVQFFVVFYTQSVTSCYFCGFALPAEPAVVMILFRPCNFFTFSYASVASCHRPSGIHCGSLWRLPKVHLTFNYSDWLRLALSGKGQPLIATV